MGASQIVLYDIPSKDPARCWSYNAWRTRFLLNFKGLDYVTEWTEYPDIKPKFENYFPELKDFTIPTIRLPGVEEYIMDSYKIAERIEKDHPSPPIFLDSPLIPKLVQHMRAALIPLQPIFVYCVYTRCISDKSIAFFSESRNEYLGMSVEEYYEQGKEGAWEKSEQGFSGVVAMLNENGGPFFMGETVSYADFIWAGILLFFKAFGEDMFQELLKASGDGGEAFEALLKAVEPWSKRDSY